MTKDKELLFSVTRKDFRIDTFKAGGPGGQNQNKRKTGCRITHPPSGAVGEARDSRSFEDNQKAAFVRMTRTSQFKAWLKLEIAKKSGMLAAAEQAADRAMASRNLRIEVVDGGSGKWVNEEDLGHGNG